jgi:hypothetical protein
MAVSTKIPEKILVTGICQICGTLAELTKPKGFDFKMCPLCAFSSEKHRHQD